MADIGGEPGVALDAGGEGVDHLVEVADQLRQLRSRETGQPQSQLARGDALGGVARARSGAVSRRLTR